MKTNSRHCVQCTGDGFISFLSIKGSAAVKVMNEAVE